MSDPDRPLLFVVALVAVLFFLSLGPSCTLRIVSTPAEQQP